MKACERLGVKLRLAREVDEVKALAAGIAISSRSTEPVGDGPPAKSEIEIFDKVVICGGVMSRALGHSLDDFTPVYMDFATGARALAQGDIDGQLQCPIPNQVMSALDASVDLRVLPYDGDDLATVLAKNSVYRRAIMKSGDLRALTHDVAQPGVVNVLVTHERQPDDSVAAVTRAIVAGAEELGRLNPLFRGMADLWRPLASEGTGICRDTSGLTTPVALSSDEARYEPASVTGN